MDFCGEIHNENCTRYTFNSQPQIINAYIIPVVCVVGLLGNIGSIVVLHKDRERREACFLLQMLSVTDFLYLLGTFFRYFVSYILDNRHQVTLRLYAEPTHSALQAATVWMLVLVTMDRYIYVCYPLQAKILFNRTRRRVLAFVVFAAAALYVIPHAFTGCRRRISDPCGSRDSLVVRNFQLLTTLQMVHTVLIFAIPLLVLLLVNLRLIIAIRNSKQSIHRELTRHNQQRSENNATFVLVIIVIAFIICETPELVLRLLTEFGYWNMTVVAFHSLSPLLMAINSSINFFIYIICGRRFRNILKETCRRSFSSSFAPRTRETLPLHPPRAQADTTPGNVTISGKRDEKTPTSGK